jgi:hypothetical protein
VEVRAALALPLLALSACTEAPPPPVRLYLREALPLQPDRFPRINADQWDLGSLSPTPPDRAEYRACGDVVLFAGAPGGALGPPAVALDWDVWWTTGTGRASLALHALDRSAPLAVVREAACSWAADDPRRDGDLYRTHTRTMLPDALAGVDPAALYLAVEGTGADVRVRSCPAGPSSITVHRSAPGSPLGPPDGARSGCALPAPPDLPTALPPAPTPTRVLPSRLEGETRLGDEVVAVLGAVQVSGPLHLDGTTLVFQAGLDGEVPDLQLGPGASLQATGARLAAADPALGFRLTTAAGVPTVLVDTVLDHPGAVSWDERGRPQARGVFLDGPADIRGGAVRHGLVALALRAAGSRVEGTRFLSNATALQVEAPNVELIDLHSALDGLFLLVDDNARGLRVRGARVQRPRAAGIRVHARDPELSLEDVRVTGAGTAGLALSGPEALAGVTFDGVLLEACGAPVDPGYVDPAAPPVVLEGVETRLSPELCPSRPD